MWARRPKDGSIILEKGYPRDLLDAGLLRMRLDGVPQLVSALGGGMSLVGPCPERTEYRVAFRSVSVAYDRGHVALRGLTGSAQASSNFASPVQGSIARLESDLCCPINGVPYGSASLHWRSARHSDGQDAGCPHPPTTYRVRKLATC